MKRFPYAKTTLTNENVMIFEIENLKQQHHERLTIIKKQTELWSSLIPVKTITTH